MIKFLLMILLMILLDGCSGEVQGVMSECRSDIYIDRSDIGVTGTLMTNGILVIGIKCYN